MKRNASVVPLDAGHLENSHHTQQSESLQPVHQTIQGEFRELLWKAVSQLPETVYACVVLRIYHELSYQQIGKVLNLNKETVKSRLHQAQKKLKDQFKNEIQIHLVKD